MAQKLLRPLLLVLFLASLFWVNTRYDIASLASIEAMRGVVVAWGNWAPLAFIGLCIAGLFLHLPEILLIALGGVLFGRVPGFFYGWIGGVTGAALTFLAARYFLRDALQSSLFARSERLRALDQRFAEHGFTTVFFLRLVLFLAPPINWAIGTTRVRFPQYLAGSALGVIPGIAITVFFADSLATVQSFTDLLTVEIMIPALLIVAFIITSAWVGRRWLSATSSGGTGS